MTKAKLKTQHPYHTLLPTHMQKMLMDAAATGSLADVDRVVYELQSSSPFRFHDKNTVEWRMFYNEPRQLVPNSGFIVPYPTTAGSRS